MKTNFDTSNPWEEFAYSIDLDVAGKYWMFWTPDADSQTITFEVNKFVVIGISEFYLQ